jgi:hypothetical protein
MTIPEVSEQRQPHQLLVKQKLPLESVQREELCRTAIRKVRSHTSRAHCKVPRLLASICMTARLQVIRVQLHLIWPRVLQIHEFVCFWVATHVGEQLRPRCCALLHFWILVRITPLLLLLLLLPLLLLL